MSFLSKNIRGEWIYECKNITLDDFRSELSTESKYVVELGRLFDACGASPIRFHYEADCVDIADVYPEAICFKSRDSYINEQIIICKYNIKKPYSSE